MVLQTRPKPNSSYASNRLTRQSGPSQSLLSTFRNNNAKDERPKPVKPEPATDDEPISSSEEDDAVNEDDSEPETRTRSRGYQSRKSFVNSSQSPAGSVRTPRASKDESKSMSNGSKKKGKEFKVPRDIEDEASPARASSPKPEFKQPPPMPEPNDMISSSSHATSSALDAAVFDDDDSSVGTPLSTASSSFMDELSRYGEAALLDEPAVCPWCKAPVDPGDLLRFRAQPKQRMREQRQFCDSHKQSSAEQEWREKGYPEIDWDTFDERITRHFADLETIMVPESASFYRNSLDTALKTGQAKNFRLSLDGDGLEKISCGYYGTRGAGKMLQAITARYGRKLRRLAADDQIVKMAGPVGYAQAVLVPELAVRLVKEDMGVNEETARQILRETIDLGEKVNFALNDEVPVPEESDAEVQ
ncbi:DAD family protein [Aspergillus niger]|uniref:Restriction of telomere capping protein 4 n=1 Tax=Aspergillus niger TaxID=5061 RepID=A0A505HSD6_ASPNG|nr:DAD family protein [Aspergillus niger]